MAYFEQEHSQLLLDKEWLVKVDNESSKPYLFKYAASPDAGYCCLMITDTCRVWAEVLTPTQIAWRWKKSNSSRFTASSNLDQDPTWRTSAVTSLNTIHTLGSILDASFEVVPSENADLAIRLEFEAPDEAASVWTWLWETTSVGPRMSADLLSQHLIMPLITATHLAFHAGEPISKLSEAALESNVDRVCRTARRSLDTHVKNAISKPRVTTTVRRITAMLNSRNAIEPIIADVDKPELVFPLSSGSTARQDASSGLNSMTLPVARSAASASKRPRSPSPAREVVAAVVTESPARSSPVPPRPRPNLVRRARESSPPNPASGSETKQPTRDNRSGPKSNAQRNVTMARENTDSVTEDEDATPPKPDAATSSVGKAAADRDSSPPAPATSKPEAGPRRLVRRAGDRAASSGASSDDSAPRPSKKAKTPVSSDDDDDDDSEAERRKHVARVMAGSAPPRGRGGARQPLKRGAKRF